MSKKRPRQPPPQRATVKKVDIKMPEVKPPAAFRIPYPVVLLAVAALALYIPSFYFKFTELDDTIFVRDFHTYNEDIHNLITSFQRGVFDALKDPYYRPLFLDSMILNYQLSGTDVMGYHVVNVLFHIISVLLLYQLFRKLNIKELHAFILALLFAVHPVLSQAVAWIPGRNDTMLAIFTFSFLIFSIDYADNGKVRSLALSAFFLLLAFFTKETAVFAAPAAFVLLVLVCNKKWLSKRTLIQYTAWAACFILWFVARYNAITQTANATPAGIADGFLHRLPLIIQYVGKVFLPFNLSVFPIQEDTVYYYGIISTLLLAALLYLNKQRNMPMILAGASVFLLFLLPVLFVPNNLNEQTFEHRLYLPVIGILLLLPQTILFNNKLKDMQVFIGGAIVCGLFALLNYQHQQNFSDPLTFWTAAAKSSPHSAYANMMLGARAEKPEESYALFHKAYGLNPKEKYLNYYYGVMLQKRDSVLQSEKYLLAEKSISDYYECDFYLARVAIERKDFSGGIAYLESYLKRDPGNKMANNNLVLLYLQTNQKDKAVAHAKHMQQLGYSLPPELMKQLGL